MGRGFDTRSLLSRAQNGRVDQGNVDTIERQTADGYSSLSTSSQNSTFTLGIVQEVISSPYEYFGNLWPDGSKTLNGQPITIGDVYSGRVKNADDGTALSSPYSNFSMTDFAPPNSVVVTLIEGSSNGQNAKPVICFPFFSSHLSLPVKTGENVWIIKFNNEIYYWMCRQTSLRQIEDVNYTFAQREKNIKNQNLVDVNDENIFCHFDESSTGLDYQAIMNSSISYISEFTGEVVPRQAKGCGDLLIQGSNNSQIYLGKEKFETVSTIQPQVMTLTAAEEDINIGRRPLSPAIDISILRKANEIFELKKLASSNNPDENQSIESSDLSAVVGRMNSDNRRYYENEKARDRLKKDIKLNEYKDLNIYNSIARIYMSNARTIDELLGISDYEGENSASPADLSENENYGTLAMLSTNTRVVGVESIKIHNVLGDSGVQITPQGDVIIFANRAGGAKIVLEAEGDIRIVPGESGILKLGSDDPVGGIVAAADSTRVNGTVESPTIVTTAAGLVADPTKPATGTFSNKVRIAVPEII